MNAGLTEQHAAPRYLREINTVHIFSLLGGMFLFVSGFLQIQEGHNVIGLIEVCLAVSLIINLAIFRIFQKLHITTSLSLIIFFVVEVLLLVHGGIAGTGLMWVHIFPVLAAVMQPVRLGFRYTLVLFFVIIAYIISSATPLPVSIYTTTELIHLLISFSIVAGVSHYFAYTIYRTERQILAINAELVQERDELARKTEELTKYLMAVEHTSDQIVITDPHGAILYANPAAEQLTGYTKEELCGKHAGAWWKEKPASPHEVEKRAGNLAGSHMRIIPQNHSVRKDGTAYLTEVHMAKIAGSHGKTLFYLFIERDITRAHEIDQMKDEFISLVSHQLRTPLSAIRWFTQLLLKNNSENLTIEQHEFLTNIYESNLRMVDLVNNLLNVSRIESGKIIVNLKPCSLQTLVSKILIDLTQSIEAKKHRVEVSIEKNMPSIVTDPNIVSNIITNILTNAIKYSPENGSISIKIGLNGDTVEIEIADTGYGIAPEEQTHMFDKFFRGENIVKVETDGNGLGMYLVKKFVDELRGTIRFESALNKGTTFWVTLPVSRNEARTT